MTKNSELIQNKQAKFKTVKIGKQEWMAENLNVDTFRNGDKINMPRNYKGWTKSGKKGKAAMCYYAFDHWWSTLYGSLYNWYAIIDPRGLAPSGWHVPTEKEWEILEKYLGMSQSEILSTGFRGEDEGGMLKATDDETEHWHYPNEGATNESGFSALPGGNIGGGGDGTCAFFWTSTKCNRKTAWGRLLEFDESQIYRYAYHKESGFSVRLIKD